MFVASVGFERMHTHAHAALHDARTQHITTGGEGGGIKDNKGYFIRRRTNANYLYKISFQKRKVVLP